MTSSNIPIDERQIARLLDESRWLNGLARKLVQDPGTAEDLAQETLLTALDAPSQPEPGSTRGWLATILRRKVASEMRGRRHRGWREEAAARGEALPDAHAVAEILESERLLRDALSELGEPYRRALTLRYREGLTAAEIARRDDEPGGTVRSRIHTGLGLLRQKLEARDREWKLALAPLVRLPEVPAAAAASGAVTSSASLGSFVAAAAVLAALAVPAAIWAFRDAEPLEQDRATLELAGSVDESPPDIAAVQPISEPRPASRVTAATPAMPAPDGTPEGEVALEPGIVQIVVVDEAGQPIAGAHAQRWDNDVTPRYSKDSDANGRLSIQLPKQRSRTQHQAVAILAPGRASARLELTFEAGTTTQRDSVVLLDGATLHGSVHDALGSGKSYGVVFVTPLPEEFKEQIEAGASLNSLGEFWEQIEFLGTFQGSDRLSGEYWLRDLPAGVRGQVLALNDDGAGQIGWSEILETRSSETLDLDPIQIRTIEERPVDPGETIHLEAESVRPEEAPAALQEIQVLASDGEPAATFQVKLLEERFASGQERPSLLTVAGTEGMASFPIPAVQWRLRVSAGEQLVEFGPFMPGEYGGPATVELTNAIAYRGTLQRAGAPVASAKLIVRHFTPEGLYSLTGELRTRAMPGPAIATTTTDADGSFRFDPLPQDSYVLGVEIQGAGVAAYPLDGSSDLELPATGSVEGRVVALHGELRSGVVTISHELGMRRTTSFRKDGTFEFRDLCAGHWFVGATHFTYGSEWLGDGDISFEPGAIPYSTTRGPANFPSRPGQGVQIADGATASVQLEVQDEPEVRVTGTVLMNGKRPPERQITFFRGHWPGGTQAVLARQARLGRDGSFSTRLPAAGTWTMECELIRHEYSLRAELTLEPDVQEPEPFHLDFATGTLVLRGEPGDGPVRVVVAGQRTTRSLLTTTRFLAPKKSGLEVPDTLAGEVKIFRLRGSANATPIASGVLSAGGRLELDLP